MHIDVLTALVIWGLAYVVACKQNLTLDHATAHATVRANLLRTLCIFLHGNTTQQKLGWGWTREYVWR